ncbi:MAG: IS3 family transposase [Phytoplasma sp.]|uniref:IS3 family transposase n=1 Tax=Phytoplasma sp. TaxID=2155 RepID=UPI002B4180DE|nr:IS3 family transposase [Phytoplasma sp.]WRH06578.1 MAG: IS3 family transposase [Phytoplasma sp.]
MKKYEIQKKEIIRQKEIELLQLVINYQKPNFRELIFVLIKFYKKYFKIKDILKLLKINRNSYYYWKKVKPIKEKRESKYKIITKRIGKLCKQNQYSFGYRKITILYFRTYKEIVNNKKVLNIMRINKWLMTYRKPYNKKSFYNKIEQKSNLINFNFKADKPLQKIYTDLTCFPTQNGKLWLSVIIDGFNNQILSSEISENPNLELVKKTFKKLPKLKEPCIMHSDQGSVYQNIQFKKYLKKKGFLISISRKAFPNDNAMIESYFGTLKGYLKENKPNFYTENLKTLNKKIKNFINYYNKHWIFAKFNYKSPFQYLKFKNF